LGPGWNHPETFIPLSIIPLSIIPLSIISLSIIPLSIIPLSIIPLSIIPLSIISLSIISLSIISLRRDPLADSKCPDRCLAATAQPPFYVTHGISWGSNRIIRMAYFVMPHRRIRTHPSTERPIRTSILDAAI
jgi:hypothetical protein